MKRMRFLRLCLVAFALGIFQACEPDETRDSVVRDQNEASGSDLQHRIESIDSRYFADFDELAKNIAISQENLREPMVTAMKNSDIKEQIINLSSASRDKASQPFAQGLTARIQGIHDERALSKSKGITLTQVLDAVSKDINVYFPVPDHRQNVLEKGEDFWVTFNPPLHDDNEYFVTAYNKVGESAYLSSKGVPRENVMVIGYSENQEKYPRLLPPVCEEGCGGGGGGTTTYYEGLRLTSVRTDNINDGWLDGDLELRIKIHQAAATISHPFGTSVLSAYTYMNVLKNHDAGTWNLFTGWHDSNKWTQINAYRKWSERLGVTVGGTTYYNPLFLVQVVEEDPIFNDEIGEVSFDSNTITWGSELYVLNGSQRCRVILDKGMYASSVY